MSTNVSGQIYRIGIDIGGTSVKLGIIDAENRIFARSTIDTQADKPYDDVMRRVGRAILDMLEANGIQLSSCSGVGIGSPGAIDVKNGVVVFAANLNWNNAPIVGELKKYIPLPVKLSNDANCAALGEVAAGAARHCQSAVLLTLGTGLGGGVVIDGKVLESALPGGMEIGHIVLREGGARCTCGRYGCLEAYASATALYREAEKAIMMFPNSAIVNPDGSLNKIDIFKAAAAGDPAAAGVVYNYLVNLAEGIIDVINVFRPEKVIIGGGISNAEGFSIAPLHEYVKTFAFGGKLSALPVIVKAKLGNDAGMIGAANL